MRSIVACLGVLPTGSARITEQLIDKNKAPNTEDEGVSRPLTSGSYPTQIGDGRWGKDSNSSPNVIAFDPFRAIRRERQLFQRKFTRLEGQGAAVGDGPRDIDGDLAAGAGHRRVADVETVFDPVREHFNCLFATARPLLANPDAIRQSGIRKSPATVANALSHPRVLGQHSSLRSRRSQHQPHRSDPSARRRSATGSEAFAALPAAARDNVLAFLNSLVLFPPDDTASNLDPGDPAAAGFPQFRHGSIKLTVLFNRPSIGE